MAENLLILLMQLAVILVATQIGSWLSVKAGMTPIVGELVAGVVLGPTVFGAALPAWQRSLFPPLGTVNATVLTSFFWVGLALLIFHAGLELDSAAVRRYIAPAAAVAVGATALTFAAGFVFAGFLPEDVFPSPHRLAFRLFFANAVAITGVPMLYKLLADLKVVDTRFGHTALLAGVIVDAIGWLILAVITRGTTAGFAAAQTLKTCGLLAAFLAAAYLLNRFVLRRLARLAQPEGRFAVPFLAAVLAFMLASAAATQYLGGQPVLGAFVAGLAVGTWGLSRRVKEKISDFAFAFFIPVLLATLGMRANLLLINSWGLWAITLAAVVAMGASVYVGGGLAARLAGLTWTESVATGAAVNLKGVLALVAAKAGHDLGVIPPNLYAILTVVSLVLTLGPVLHLQFLRRRLAAA